MGNKLTLLFVCLFSIFTIPTPLLAGGEPALELPIEPASGKGDPLLAKAWHLTEMNTFEAWKTTKGSRDVVISFVDSGINYLHPDLAPNLAWNKAEWPCDGTDKDQNGFKDDVIGFDFTRNHYLPWDGGGHGTFLAGLAVAVEGNGVGSAGVCPRCSVMAAKFINRDGFGDDDDAIRAIQYSILMKAKIINVSFSGEGYDKKLFKVLEAAGEADIVVVAAASNDGTDLDKQNIYPAKFKLPNLITVAAVNAEHYLWKHSNWGKKSVHVAAPAEDVVSIWKAGKDGYDSGSGTSDAAAIVSGLAGLVRSANPGLTAAQVVEVISRTVKLLPELEGKTISGGQVDAAAAVRCATDGLRCLHAD